jgi:hypothetical protein
MGAWLPACASFPLKEDLIKTIPGFIKARKQKMRFFVSFIFNHLL